MAWRDAKASRVRLLLFMSSIILGISAVVAIQLFSENLSDNIQKQSKNLMGADYIIDTRQEPTERAQEIIDSLKPDAKEVNFVSMIAFPKNGGTKLVNVRGMQGDFPFYGSMKTEPIYASSIYQERNGALVDATLLLQFDIIPGDSIKVGKVTFPIIGALKSVPGSNALSTSVAPPVIVPYNTIDATELLQFGSRKEYQFFYKASDTLDLNAFESKVDPMLDIANADLDTHTSTSRRLGRRYENVGKFLNLAAFIALLLGCIGIASSVHIYIKEKLKAIAILKCLGASRKQSFLIFLLQISGIGVLGGLIGSSIGVALQGLFPYILKSFLPFEVEMSISIQPIIIGILLGLFMSVLFALIALLHTWYVSPLKVLRISEEPVQPRIVRTLVFCAIMLFLYLFSLWLLKDATYALVFVLGALITFIVIAVVANFFMKLVRRFFPKSWSFTARQGLLNLYRPNNQTVVLILAIGLGTFLISTLYFTKDILLAKTEVGPTAENANIIILDVQSNQRQEMESQLKTNEVPILDNIPLVTMRMHKIKDKLVNDLKQDTTRQVRGWILNHEFRTTYRDKLIASEELIAGKWKPSLEKNEGIVISISDNLAEDAKVDIGDKIVFNVQGVLMETTVGSIRQVDWGRMQLNFSIVFPKGVLEDAPQFSVFTTAASDEKASAKLQRNLVDKFPNVTIIDLRQVFNIVEDILEKVSWVINFMAFFSIITGFIVLVGSVRTSKYQRIKESVLLRTLGAKNTQILKISALEYLFLGALGSLVGILLALISGLCLALFIFQEPFTPSLIPFIVFLPGITLLVLLIGLSNIRSVLSSSPLEVLRREV
ncbi:ABC transporter permease [Winogradskyella alexanderae]|uniref:ABC transporter permease n=1 Tax=Winogradskyella alexanderae TaxID=2877123 RepID=A0ABS7XRT4_9FLAO|nr:FtsX-like permease family protein [Winogradskyella alexanderae]MCA0132737.1 ABC transporter permease [Winogradskyella alexanderae]